MPYSFIQKIKKIFQKEKSMAVRAGHFAPDFELESHLDTKVRLSSFRGKKNVVIAFFPLAFTPI
jgi:mycoredoxin-dependent peroxiredoxin